MDVSTIVAGHMDASRAQQPATQRDRMRELIERKGGTLPPSEAEPAAARASSGAPTIKVDRQALAREEDGMQGYHGLTVDDASGMKMFCKFTTT